MGKFFTTLNEQWDETDSYQFPPSCLACTIKNDGGSLILIDEVIELKPKRSYIIPNIAGYKLTGSIRIKEIKTTAPYSDNTKLIFRNAVETNI